MTKDDIEIIYPPCNKSLDELITEFKNIDREEIYETITVLRMIKNDLSFNLSEI